jgi:hypothetical protein
VRTRFAKLTLEAERVADPRERHDSTDAVARGNRLVERGPVQGARLVQLTGGKPHAGEPAQ